MTKVHPATGEPLTPATVKASYAAAIREGDFTLRWLLDHLVADDADLRAARDSAADAAAIRAARYESIGYQRLEVKHVQ